MNKALKLNFLIIRKTWKWDKLFYRVRDGIIALVVLGGLKYGLMLIPTKGLMEIYWMIAIFMFGFPISDVSYVRMSAGHLKMLTYFKQIPIEDIDRYYTYRRFTMFTIWSIFFLVPLSTAAMPAGLFALSLLGTGVMLKTSIQRIFKDERVTKYADAFVKLMVIGSFFFIARRYVDPQYVATMINATPLYVFIIWIMMTYGLTYINVGLNYGLMQSASSRTVRSKYIKDHHLLFVLRGPLISSLVTIFLMSFIAFDQALLSVVGFASTILSNYFIIYQGLLQNDKDKIQLLYRPSELHRIRLDKIVPILKVSVIYLLLALVIGIYVGNVFGFIASYAITTVVFAGTVAVLKISIEKGKNNKIFTWQDAVKLLVFSTGLVLILVNFLQ